MRAGQLRHLITIEDATESQDEYGEPDLTWSMYTTAWAKVEPLSSRETVEARSVYQERTHRITMRHQDGITPNMRVNWDGRLFDIEGVRNVEERNRMLELNVKEVV